MVAKRMILPTALVVVTVVALPFLPQVPQSLAAATAKRGTVIDHSLNRPLDGAFVLVTRYLGQNGFASSGGCVSIALTHTDINGRYSIPSQWKKWRMGVPGFDPRQFWLMYVFKRGYTAAASSELPGNRRLPLYAAWDSEHDAYTWQGMTIEVAPIELQQGTLRFEERVQDLAKIKDVASHGCPADAETQKQIGMMLDEFYKEQEQYVCGAAPDGQTDYKTLANLNWLLPTVDQVLAFSKVVRKSLPSYDPSWTSYAPSGLVSFETVCKIMRDGERP